SKMSGVEDFANMITSSMRTKEMDLPEVRRIEDINEFMSNKDNYNGDIDELLDKMNEKTERCEHALSVMKTKVDLKMASLHKVKTDMMELNDELKKPGATKRFVTNKEKIAVHFLDETEMQLMDIPTALESFSLKMSSLYNEIMSMDCDMDYVNYLTGISRLNVKYITEWHE
ncbi:hypothetical protein KR018_007191, partial [Drosophila ironensis]